MSINTANTPDGRGVLIFNGEVILVYAENVYMSFESNQNEGLKGKFDGTLYLTSHRVIFMAGASSWFRSFEMPFGCMQNVTLEQPIFGANYLRGIARAMQGSQLRGEVPWRLTFNSGGCIDFGHSLLEAVDRASRVTRPANAPPEYTPSAGNFYSAPPAYYTPQQNGNFNIPSAFPTRPNPENVFVNEAPPPYPGMGSERPPQPTEEMRVAGQNADPPPYAYETADNLRRRR